MTTDVIILLIYFSGFLLTSSFLLALIYVRREELMEDDVVKSLFISIGWPIVLLTMMFAVILGRFIKKEEK